MNSLIYRVLLKVLRIWRWKNLFTKKQKPKTQHIKQKKHKLKKHIINKVLVQPSETLHSGEADRKQNQRSADFLLFCYLSILVEVHPGAQKHFLFESLSIINSLLLSWS